VNLNNVPDCSTYQFVAFLGVYELECGPILSVVISSHKATFSTFFNFMNLFLKFMSKIKFIKFELHNYGCSSLVASAPDERCSACNVSAGTER